MLLYPTAKGVTSAGEFCLSDPPDYSERFLDHYRRPRNLGDLEKPDAVAIVHDDTCGDVLRLAINVDRRSDAGERYIRAIRFKAYGCAATIAAGSALTELAAGRPLEEARTLTEQHVIDALGGLPPGRLHAAILAREALAQVLGRA